MIEFVAWLGFGYVSACLNKAVDNVQLVQCYDISYQTCIIGYIIMTGNN